jgi:hypothetical protein
MFDVPPPNEVRGIDAYRKTWPPRRPLLPALALEAASEGKQFWLVSAVSGRSTDFAADRHSCVPLMGQWLFPGEMVTAPQLNLR